MTTKTTPPTPPPLRIGSLFSGYGGLDLGVQAVLGGDVAWVCEFDDNPSRILAHHHPDIPNLGDITKAQWAPDCPHGAAHKVRVFRFGRADDETAETVYRCTDCGWELDVDERPDGIPYPVDILSGGFPCQDVSHAGRRKGLIRDGKGRTRSGLWGQMLLSIDTIRPALVVAENVRGLLNATADSDVEPCPWCMGEADASPMRALGAVLADLADIGYDAAWVGLPASGVGAPHGRFRVFILAWPSDDERSREPLRRAAPRTRHDDQPLTLLKTPTAQLAINGGSQHPDKRKDGGHGPTLADEVEHLLPTPAVNDMGAGKSIQKWDEWTARMKRAHGNGNGHGASLAIEALRMEPTTLLPTPTAMDSHASGGGYNGQNNVTRTDATTRAARRGINFGDYAPAIARWEDVLGRPAPSPTEVSDAWRAARARRFADARPVGMRGTLRRFLRPERRLSPTFVEWMMGLPPGHVTDVPGLGRNAQLKALGNGVVPQQAAVALEYLLDVRASALAEVV